MTGEDRIQQSGGWTARILAWRRLRSRLRLGTLAVVLVVGVLAGVIVGRVTAPPAGPTAAAAIEARVLPLVIDADGIWNSPSDERLPVAEALVALRHDGDPDPVREGYEDWLAAYDSILVRLAGIDLPASARPIQRQFMAAVMLSRDAVEVLGHAALVSDAQARRDLTTEVGRLRQRSEQLTQAARASVADLKGRRADVAPPSSLPGFLESRP